MTVLIDVVFQPKNEATPLPSYATAGAAGMDVHADIPANWMETIPSGESRLISTGLKVAIPDGYEIQVRPRSGLALKKCVTVGNSPGTIDSDYRGEIGIILINHGPELFPVFPGDRIAQLVVAPVTRGMWNRVDELPGTARGEGGFGSTGHG